ncbi:hypothetical protein EMIHUDRAFT_202460 [Emiliania huxleyi CCMP1516]|uniref:Uncharacterized protein n=2 Tax=Emiliania huxleyi TaxID=2903 RepID=A0A0D3KBT1_EMIH1|nr:hypothetical protein EMIHUDRAFT_202460 [Emiliania huxleyi CCMP1516]EOD33216.1 hypothetical protein EMIHUDRAFT_202460 [Emiliania huxleyi CCMP1516]|eukprot:XP_005785645.1 hypothetical protein EMIHUDRAFT_202460 [Emiliania huxleyi CCMP1516]
MMQPSVAPPTKAYLLEKKSGGIAEIKHRGLKEKIPVIKHLGGGGGDDDDLNGRAPIRAVLQKVDVGLKKITGSITDLLGDDLGGLLDNLLKKVYSFVKNNALELGFLHRIAGKVNRTIEQVLRAIKGLLSGEPGGIERLLGRLLPHELFGKIRGMLNRIFRTDDAADGKTALDGIFNGSLRKLFKKLNKFISSIFETLNDLLANLNSLVVGTLQKTGELDKNVFEGRVFSSIKSLVLYVLGDTLGFVKNTLNRVGGFLKRLSANEAAEPDGITCNSGCGGIGGLIDRVLGRVLGLTGNILEGVFKIGEAIEKLLGGAIGNLLEHFKSGFIGGLETLRGIIKGLLCGWLPCILSSIDAFLSEIAGTIGCGLEKVKKGLRAILRGDDDDPDAKGVLGHAGGFIRSIIGQVGDVLDGILPGIRGRVKGLLEKVFGTDETAGLLRTIFGLVRELVGFGDKLTEHILSAVNGAVGDLLGDLFGALSPIAEKIGGFLGGIDDAVVGLVERVVTRVGGIVHGLGWVLENPFSGVHQILGWVRKLVGKIIPDDANILKNLKEHFGGDEIKILDALLGAPRALATWCARRAVGTLLYSLMGGIQSFLKGLGQDIGGLLRTIIGMLGGKQPRDDDEEGIIKAILGKADGLVHAVVGGVRSFLRSLHFKKQPHDDAEDQGLIKTILEKLKKEGGLAELFRDISGLVGCVLGLTWSVLGGVETFILKIFGKTDGDATTLPAPGGVRGLIQSLLGTSPPAFAEALEKTKDLVVAILGGECGLLSWIVGDLANLIGTILLTTGLLLGGVGGLLWGIYNALERCIGHIHCGMPLSERGLLDIDIHPCTIPLVQVKLCGERHVHAKPMEE